MQEACRIRIRFFRFSDSKSLFRTPPCPPILRMGCSISDHRTANVSFSAHFLHLGNSSKIRCLSKPPKISKIRPRSAEVSILGYFWCHFGVHFLSFFYTFCETPKPCFSTTVWYFSMILPSKTFHFRIEKIMKIVCVFSQPSWHHFFLTL